MEVINGTYFYTSQLRGKNRLAFHSLRTFSAHIGCEMLITGTFIVDIHDYMTKDSVIIKSI